MDGNLESGEFDKPDPVTKSRLFAEDRDTISTLTKERDDARKQNRYAYLVAAFGVIVGGFGVWKADTKYYMVEKSPDRQTIIYTPDRVEFPVSEVIKRMLIDFVADSTAISSEMRVNKENRWKALEMVQMSKSERYALYDMAVADLNDNYKNVTAMVTDIMPMDKGGNFWTVEYTVTARDRPTGRQQSTRKAANVEVVITKQTGDNPAGIQFSKPLESNPTTPLETPK